MSSCPRITCASCHRNPYFASKFREHKRRAIPVRLRHGRDVEDAVLFAEFAIERPHSCMSLRLAQHIGLRIETLPYVPREEPGMRPSYRRVAKFLVAVPSSPEEFTLIENVTVNEDVREPPYFILGSDSLRDRFYVVMMPSGHFCVFRRILAGAEKRSAGRFDTATARSAAQFEPGSVGTSRALPRITAKHVGPVGNILDVEDISLSGMCLRAKPGIDFPIDSAITAEIELSVDGAEQRRLSLEGSVRDFKSNSSHSFVHVKLRRAGNDFEEFQRLMEEASAEAAFWDPGRCGNE